MNTFKSLLCRLGFHTIAKWTPVEHYQRTLVYGEEISGVCKCCHKKFVKVL